MGRRLGRLGQHATLSLSTCALTKKKQVPMLLWCAKEIKVNYSIMSKNKKMRQRALGGSARLKRVHVGGIVVRREKDRTKVPCDSFSPQVFLFFPLKTQGWPSFSLYAHTHTHTLASAHVHPHSSLVHPLLCIQMASEHSCF